MSSELPPDPDEFERRAAARRAKRRPGRGRPRVEVPKAAIPRREMPRLQLPRLRRPPPGSSTDRRRLVAFAALGAVGIVILWLVVSLFQPLKGDGAGRVAVTIPRGAGSGAIADLLEREGVISNGTFFELRLTLAGKRGDIQAGPYTLARDMSYGEAIDALAVPPAERVLAITFPEGLSRQEAARVVRQSGVRGDYEGATRSYPGFRPSRFGARGGPSLEGFLFPATYELPPGASVRRLVGKQLQAFERAIAGVSLRRARERNLTAYDILIIASMIEREVSVPRERRLVAAVIYNRLRAREPLGIDATVRYATRNWTRPLSRQELAIDSAYNTRRRAGLPPTPIGSPGLASIRAAANPARSDAFYYVVKPNTCNEHTFAASEAAFQRAQAAYERARREAGGRAPTTCPEE